MRISTVSPVVLLLVVLCGCGDEGQPSPGYSDPCASPLGGVLGCPADSQLTVGEVAGVADVCQKLVSCGILAREYLGGVGEVCSTSGDCPGGQCFKHHEDSEEKRCHFSHLDYRWCVGRLTSSRSDPCNHEQRFSAQQIEAMVHCIGRTPCLPLGLPFSAKLISSDNRPELDRYSCNDSETIWTATICDHGLLQY